MKDVSFFFPAGEITFVIGRSGSGKSTLSNLLLRFYNPAAGEIWIDDESIQTLDTGWLRSNLTVVQQQSVLFNETIFKNVAFGKRDYESVKKEELIQSLEMTAMQDTIDKLPNGLETLVGSGGNEMSGGQKQRIAIARARLRDTPILILDEATSALDHTMRSIVVDGIRKWRKGKTTIIITHDISQIEDNEYAYLLDGGTIVQEGYRNALLKDESGLFASLLQSGAVRPKANTAPDARHALQHSSALSGFSIVGRLSSDSSDIMDTQSKRRSRMRAYSSSGNPSYFHRKSQAFTSPVNPAPRPVTQEFLVDENADTNGASFKALPSYAKRWKNNLFSTEDEQQVESLMSVLGTVWPRLTYTERMLLICGFAFAFVHAAATPVFSWAFSQLLTTFFRPSGSAEALKWSLSILMVGVVDGTASFLMHYLLEACGQAWVDSLRVEALRRVLDQPRSWFDQNENGVSSLTESLDRNAEEMRNLLGRFTGRIFVAVVMTMVGIVWSLIVCWKLTLVGIAAAPILYGVTQSFEIVSGKWEAKSNNAAEAAGSVFTDTFINIGTVRALTLEGYFHQKHRKATRVALNIGLRRAIYSGIFFGTSDAGIISVTGMWNVHSRTSIFD